MTGPLVDGKSWDSRPVMFSHSLPPALQIQIQDKLHLLGISILVYDHLLTLDREVKHIWALPKARSAWLFLPNRYFFLFASLPLTVTNFMTGLNNQKTCLALLGLRQLALLINQGMVCILLSLRVYALYGGSRRIAVTLTSSLLIMAIGIFCSVLLTKRLAPYNFVHGCHAGIPWDRAVRLVIAWESLFAYDLLLFCLTAAKTWQTRRRHGNVPILRLVFRDGLAYFAIIALTNGVNIMTYWLSGPFLKGGLSVFAASLSTTMMSRLMLNLHALNNLGIYTTYAPGELDVSRQNNPPLPTPRVREEGGVELDSIWTADLHPEYTLYDNGPDYHSRSNVSTENQVLL